jgi:hypothetical protein
MVGIMRKYMPARVAAMALLVAFALCSRAAAGEKSFTAQLNLLFDDGTMMFYVGSNNGLAQGDVYDLVAGGDTVATVGLVKVDTYYSVAKIASPGAGLKEGAVYEFRPVGAAAENASKTEKKGVSEGESLEKSKIGAGESENGEEGRAPAEKKDLAKGSTRRSKHVTEDEGTQPPATNKQTVVRKKSKTEKEESRKPVEKNKRKEANAQKTLPKPLYNESPNALGYRATSFSGGLLLPTVHTIPKNRARLGFNYFHLNGQEGYNKDTGPDVYNFTMNEKIERRGFSFGYGASDRAEVTISGAEKKEYNHNVCHGCPADTISTQKTNFSSIGLKYHLTSQKLGDKSHSIMNFEVALIGSWEQYGGDEADNSEMFTYGLVGEFPLSRYLKINAMYADTDVTNQNGGGKTSSDPIFGIGLEQRAHKDFRYYLEFLKLNNDERFRTIGLRYSCSSDLNFDLGYLQYEHQHIMEGVNHVVDLTADSYLFGMNYTF